MRLLATDTSAGALYISTDAGLSWNDTNCPGANLTGVASSADGVRLVAGHWNGNIYTSDDSGGTWAATNAPTANYWRITSSADGKRLLAFTDQNTIYSYVSSNTTTPGTAGGLKGEQLSAIELQYVGNNLFIIISNRGDFSSM